MGQVKNLYIEMLENMSEEERSEHERKRDMRSTETLQQTLSDVEAFLNSPEVTAIQQKAFELELELESYNMGKTLWDRTYETKHPSKTLRDAAWDAGEKLDGFLWQGCLAKTENSDE